MTLVGPAQVTVAELEVQVHEKGRLPLGEPARPKHLNLTLSRPAGRGAEPCGAVPGPSPSLESGRVVSIMMMIQVDGHRDGAAALGAVFRAVSVMAGRSLWSTVITLTIQVPSSRIRNDDRDVGAI